MTYERWKKRTDALDMDSTLLINIDPRLRENLERTTSRPFLSRIT